MVNSGESDSKLPLVMCWFIHNSSCKLHVSECGRLYNNLKYVLAVHSFLFKSYIISYIYLLDFFTLKKYCQIKILPISYLLKYLDQIGRILFDYESKFLFWDSTSSRLMKVKIKYYIGSFFLLFI